MSKIREKIVFENKGVMAKTGQKTSKQGLFVSYQKSRFELLGISGDTANNTVKNVAHLGARANGHFGITTFCAKYCNEFPAWTKNA